MTLGYNLMSHCLSLFPHPLLPLLLKVPGDESRIFHIQSLCNQPHSMVSSNTILSYDMYVMCIYIPIYVYVSYIWLLDKNCESQHI